MKVYIVGSSGTFPAPGRPAAGYVIEQGETRVWCDAGPGTFMSLPMDPDLIDAVVISHHHPDHCSDLFAAYHAWTYRPEPREPVPLYAPRGVWDRVSAFIDKEPECFVFTPVWDGDRAEIGDIQISFVEADHSVPAVASSWESGNRKLFYTGDTGPAGSWARLASGANLMISEASYQGASAAKPFSQHLTAGEAGEIARAAGAEKLVLTHIPPYLDPTISVAEAEATFDRPVRLAVPGTSFDV